LNEEKGAVQAEIFYCKKITLYLYGYENSKKSGYLYEFIFCRLWNYGKIVDFTTIHGGQIEWKCDQTKKAHISGGLLTFPQFARPHNGLRLRFSFRVVVGVGDCGANETGYRLIACPYRNLNNCCEC